MIVHCSSSTSLWGKQSVRGIIRCWFGILRCVPQIGLLSVNSCWSLHGSWGGDRIQNMLYVDPCTVVQFMAYFCVPNYVPCEYFSDIRTVFPFWPLLCPVSSCPSCFAWADPWIARPCFQFSSENGKCSSGNGKIRRMSGRNFQDLGPSQVLKWPNAEVRSRQSSKAILMIL